MPSSLIVVALVVAWLVVLVPMVVRKRQEIARTADSALAARVVRSGAAHDVGGDIHDVDDLDEDTHEDLEDHEPEDSREVFAMSDVDQSDTDVDEFDDAEDEPVRRYRPGRGGFNPEAAARAARAKYGARQRIVLLLLVLVVATALAAALLTKTLWWAHGGVDLMLVGYLTYLRRQVRIEEEIRRRRHARMQVIRRHHARPLIDDEYEDDYDEAPRERLDIAPRTPHPGAVVIDIDDEDPWFEHLGDPGHLPYRRAVGE